MYSEDLLLIVQIYDNIPISKSENTECLIFYRQCKDDVLNIIKYSKYLSNDFDIFYVTIFNYFTEYFIEVNFIQEYSINLDIDIEYQDFSLKIEVI